MNAVFLPKAHYILSSLKDHGFSKDVQHPFAIWNMAYADVMNKFSALSGALENVVKNNKHDPQIYSFHQILLTALCKFWRDDTSEIVKALLPHGRVCKSDVQKFLTRRSKEYLTQPAKIINKIKHNQRQIFDYNAYIDEKILPGFFIAMNKGGRWQACNEVHFRKDDFASSYFYELRRLFTGLYSHGNALTEVIISMMPNIVAEPPHHDCEQYKLAKSIYQLPLLFFPNEFSQTLPTVEETATLSEITRNKIALKLPRNCSITTEIIYSGDGVTKEFTTLDLKWNRIRV
jgi:hypothetical protein